MIVLTEFERDQLLDHLRKCPDIWLHSGGVWMRSTDEDHDLGLQFQKHEIEGQAVYAVNVHVLEGSADEAHRFVDRLVRHWTSFLSRCRLQTVLETHGIDSGDAELLAMKLFQIAITPIEAPGFTPDLPEVETTPPDGEQTFLLQGGGYVRVKTFGRQAAQTTLSLPSGGKHLAFGSPLEGFLTGPVHSHAPSGRLHG